MTPDKRKEAAAACFKANPKDKLYHQTVDGQCFNNWHDANEHSKSLEDRAIEEVNREEKKQVEKESYQEKIDKINACTTVEELGAIKVGNKENPEVAKAMSAKMDELQAEAEKLKAGKGSK